MGLYQEEGFRRSYEMLLYKRKGRIAYVALNRPRILNIYDGTMGDALKSRGLSL
jgi:enoyl-CoA hydratase/carnithine racemase